jgi:serine/threonine protein kinase
LSDVVNEAPGSIFAPGLVFQTRYRLDEPLAAGGMAQVWRGEDLVLQRSVAIKLLHPHLANDETVMERFRREAIAAARLAHPNIVPTFDTGSDHGVSYIVLGLIDGPDLATVLKEHTFTPLQTCALGRQIADALDYAHRQGLIHRDIKPSNVLLVDDNTRVMVADFGIARVISESLDPSLTLPGVAIGTPHYLAPEITKDVEPGPSVDIFSLGILLHEMHCGHAITDVPTQDIKPEDVGRVQLCPNIPRPLNDIVSKATRHDPNDRYITAAELRDALRDAEAEFQKSLTPPPPPPPDQDPNPTSAIPPVRPLTPKALKPTKQPIKDVALARVAARKRKTTTFIVIGLLILAAILIGRFFGGLSASHHTTKATPPTPITFNTAASFDPLGSDKAENESQTKNAIDNDPSTSWATETYSNHTFGNLKAGVGLVLTLSEPATITDIKVTSPSTDWAASIYVAPQAAPALAGWGHPITQQTHIDAGSTTFHLSGAEGGSVLIWITDLGKNNKVTIADVSLDTI